MRTTEAAGTQSLAGLRSLVTFPLAYMRARTRGASPGKQRSRRQFWEVDALRGIAIVMMVVYHLMYDLYFFGITDAIFSQRFWFYFQRTTATTFILLVGISLAISRARSEARGQAVPVTKLARRGVRIFGWGMVISLVTFLALGPALYIRFGVLHFIGVAILFAYPFLRYRRANLVLGVLLIAAGKVLQRYTFDWPWLVWLGFEPANHVYVDYFPVIPWFGVVLLGIYLGNTLYQSNSRTVELPDLSGLLPVRILQRLGQHSLTAYLIHQPILFAILVPLLLLLGLGTVAF